MAQTSASARLGNYIWARTSFDIEGIVGALAAWLFGLLLGAIWSPLFWLGFIAAIVVLFATRKQTRTPPELANLVIAPCDGIVQSVTRVVPPTELRIGSVERLRLRISSSPIATNPIYAVMNGEVASLIVEEADPAVIFATEPDVPGMAIAHISYESLGQIIGCSVATGGFGPRLEMLSEIGDPVRAGRVVGKRRLGGWCDVYLDADARVLVRAGQTLIGGETMLCRLVRGPVGEQSTVAASENSGADRSEFDSELSAEEASAALMARLKLQSDKDDEER